MYTVCLVEDEEALANVVKAYLERAGYKTICFTKGSEAINYIGNKVDIWILDIMLGDDVNGYDVIKAIREHDDNVPVIFTSARDQELDKIFGLELGSDDYMTKPYSSKELVLRVNKIIKRVYKDNSQVNIINYDDYFQTKIEFLRKAFQSGTLSREKIYDLYSSLNFFSTLLFNTSSSNTTLTSAKSSIICLRIIFLE